MFDKNCRWLDSKPDSLFSEAIGLPDVPQLLAKIKLFRPKNKSGL